MTNPNDPTFTDREIFCGLDTNNNAINRMIGLTKREHLAALAMQGYLSIWADPNVSGSSPAEVAALAVQYADALIAALNAEPK